MAIQEPPPDMPDQPPARPVTISSPAPEAETPPGSVEPDPPPAATIIVQLPRETIFICHPDGWRLEVRDGDILGRTTGQHTARLGVFPVISGRHAQISRQGAQWRIADLGSTNKTYVNGTKLEPNTPVHIKKNDVLNLANITFTVEEG
jgi:pSer/pThr/pTyr-binding forkhead associated (FHA) protein